jgi:hypothetical protein
LGSNDQPSKDFFLSAIIFFFSDDFEDRKKGTKHLMLTNNLVQVKLVSIIVLSLLSLIFPT